MFSLDKKVRLSFEETIQLLTEELKKEGFGVLTQIDIKDTLKKKIDQDFRPYTILGACNPHFASMALNRNNKMGVFLPCNIVVQQHADGQVEISVGNPEDMMKDTSNQELMPFAHKVKKSMERVLSNIS